eukprot:Skav225931  [mRNA]  locus=scaffold1500:359587:359811:- [translate_table: standard]
MAGGSITGTVGGSGASQSNPSTDVDSPRGQAFGLDAAPTLKTAGVGWGVGMADDSAGMGNDKGVGAIARASSKE